MGTGKKKKIEIKKITNEKYRLITLSRRRKGLFNKAKKLESMTDARVATIIFSPTGRLSTYGDVNSAIERHFPNSSCTKQSNSDVVADSDGSSGSKSSSTSKRNGLRDWVKGIDVERCQDLNQLLLLKKQLEGTRENILSIEDAKSFEALFA